MDPIVNTRRFISLLWTPYTQTRVTLSLNRGSSTTHHSGLKWTVTTLLRRTEPSTVPAPRDDVTLREAMIATLIYVTLIVRHNTCGTHNVNASLNNVWHHYTWLHVNMTWMWRFFNCNNWYGTQDLRWGCIWLSLFYWAAHINIFFNTPLFSGFHL